MEPESLQLERSMAHLGRGGKRGKWVGVPFFSVLQGWGGSVEWWLEDGE